MTLQVAPHCGWGARECGPPTHAHPQALLLQRHCIVAKRLPLVRLVGPTTPQALVACCGLQPMAPHGGWHIRPAHVQMQPIWHQNQPGHKWHKKKCLLLFEFACHPCTGTMPYIPLCKDGMVIFHTKSLYRVLSPLCKEVISSVLHPA